MGSIPSFVNNCELVVLDIGYNLLVCGIVGIDKVIYVHKFPPALNTTEKPKIPLSQAKFEHQINRELRKETVINFWKSTNLYQANGDWKGGEWGSNNLPTTSSNFCTDVFIGDILRVKDIKNGIIPYPKRLSKPFEESDEIIPGSEDFALSANITSDNSNLSDNSNQTYSCYICEKPMPQSAIDVLFVWENSLKHKFVKILKRGLPNPNVDMPKLRMPGAGEHREPGNKICFKADALRAINEEIGIDNTTLSRSYLIPIGTFNDKKRDPRYWSYSVYQDNKMITFGPERESETNVYVLFIKTETNEEPGELENEDKIEVGSKYWIGFDDPILSNKELWMIPEHSEYFACTKTILESFENMKSDEKESYKFILGI